MRETVKVFVIIALVAIFALAGCMPDEGCGCGSDDREYLMGLHLNSCPQYDPDAWIAYCEALELKYAGGLDDVVMETEMDDLVFSTHPYCATL